MEAKTGIKLAPEEGTEPIDFRQSLENEQLADKATGIEHHPKPVSNTLPLVSKETHKSEYPYVS